MGTSKKLISYKILKNGVGNFIVKYKYRLMHINSLAKL